MSCTYKHKNHVAKAAKHAAVHQYSKSYEAMLRELSNIFRRRSSGRNLSAAAQVRIKQFTESQNLINSVRTENDRLAIFLTLIDVFEATFEEVDSDMVKNDAIIGNALQTYVKECSKLLRNMVHNQDLSTKMFASLERIHTLYGGKMPSEDFMVPMFAQLIGSGAGNASVIPPAFGFLRIMFGTPSFIHGFKEIEGLGLVFKSFFLSDNNEIANLLICLLFKICTADICSDQNPAMLETCIEELASNTFQPIAVFTVNFVAACYVSDSTVLARFRDDGGFLILNKFMMKNCDDATVTSCYSLLLEKTELHFIVVHSVYELFAHENNRVCLRTGLLKTIVKGVGVDREVVLLLDGAMSIKEWVLAPPLMDMDGYGVLSRFLFDITERGFIGFDVYAQRLLNVIAPPLSGEKPVSEFLGVFEKLIATYNMTIPELLSYDFIETFVTHTDSSVFSEYLRFREMQQLVYSVMGSNVCEDFFPIIRKVIDVYEPGLAGFVVSLLRTDLPIEVFHFLIVRVTDTELTDVILDVMRTNPVSMDRFIESNGFEYVNEFLETKTENNSIVLRLLEALTAHQPKEEVELFVGALNREALLFSCDRKLLVAAAKNIGALVGFLGDIEVTSPLRVRNACVHGIPLCKKLGIPLCDIPMIRKLANCFCSPEMVEFLINDKGILYEVVDRAVFPQCDVLEFGGAGAYIDVTASDVVRTLSLSILAGEKTHGRLLTIGSTVVSLEGESVTITHEGATGSMKLAKGWNVLSFTFGAGMINCEMNYEVIELLSSDAGSKTLRLGGANHSTSLHFVISWNIIVNGSNDRKALAFNGCIYKVPFEGFASFFPDVWSVETIFQVLESATTFGEFASVYKTLLNLHLVNDYDDTYFYSRVLTSVKKMKSVIGDKLKKTLIDISAATYDRKHYGLFVNAVLGDVELYFLYSPASICQILEALSSAVIEYAEDMDDNAPKLLMHIMGAGVDPAIRISMVAVIQGLLEVKGQPKHIAEFVRSVLTVCDWPLEVKFDDPIAPILNNGPAESSLQTLLLDCALQLVSNCNRTLFTMNELIMFSLRFEDERAFCFLKMIAIYSSRDKEYAACDSCVRLAFSRFVLVKEVWEIAFAVWAGCQVGGDSFVGMNIERPLFTAAILAMMVTLFRREAHHALYSQPPEAPDIMLWALDILIELPVEQMSFFAHRDFSTYLALLLNFGIVPESVGGDTTGEARLCCKWNEVETVTLTADEIAQISDGSDLFKDPQILEASRPVVKYEQFPIDHMDSNWLGKLPMADLMSFIARVIVSVPVQNFETFFLGLAVGHGLMYDSYRCSLTRNLSFALLTLFAESKEPLKRNPLKAIWNFVPSGVFAEQYARLVALVLPVVKRQMDDSMIKPLRSILLLAFHFIQPGDIQELFNTVFEFNEVVFHRSVLSDVKFCHLWLYKTGEIGSKGVGFLECMSICYRTMKQAYINSYNAEETSTRWAAFLEEQLTTPMTQCHPVSPKLLIKKTSQDIVAFSQGLLMAQVRRVAGIHVRLSLQLDAINGWLRSHESFYFKYKQIERTLLLGKQETNAFFMSQMALPFCVRRVVSPSPFEVQCPQSDEKAPISAFRRPFTAIKSQIKRVNDFGESLTSPEWFYFHTEDGESPFNYSLVLKHPRMNILNDFTGVYGMYTKADTVVMHNYIHPIPCVLFTYPDKMVLMVLASINETALNLIQAPDAPIAFLPFTEAVTLNEWHDVSLFCGHVILSFTLSSRILSKPHLYVHEERAISFSFLFNPTFVIVFEAERDCRAVAKWLKGTPTLQTRMSGHRFLFTYDKRSDAQTAWIQRKLSSYDYLLVLNALGGRSFADLCQYPVFPWVSSPDLKPRDMSLPMGQLNEKRAKHYDATYNDSDPRYFYGCHYSLPGVVFWFMVRLPPFPFFSWDLNEGWNDPKRMFISIADSYLSASEANYTDLKEPIPEMFTVPEVYVNTSKLGVADVVLPEWAMNSPFHYVAMMRKSLEENESLHSWIDLIFGFKQTGEQAIANKNLFLPSSYHSSSAKGLDIDGPAFEDQVAHFGQCPIQLFDDPHPQRTVFDDNSDKNMLDSHIHIEPCDLRNPQSLDPSTIARNATILPKLSCVIAPGDFCIVAEEHKLVVRRVDTLEIHFESRMATSSAICALSISDDGMFVAVCFKSGKVNALIVQYENRVPSAFANVHQFSTCEPFECSAVAVSGQDFLAAAVFGPRIIVFNFGAKLRHRVIDLDATPLGICYDSLEGVLTVAFSRKLEQYSVNGAKLHQVSVDRELTCFAVIGYEPRFDGRLVVTGDVEGMLSFFCVIESFNLRMLFERQGFETPVRSIAFDQTTLVLWACDSSAAATIDFAEAKRRFQ